MPKQFKNDFKVGRIVAHIRKKDNGVFEIRCQVQKRKISVSAKLLDTAKEKFINALKCAENGENTAKIRRNISLGEYMLRWLETVKKPYIKAVTYNDYLKAYRFYIEPSFGSRPLSSIGQFELQAFFNSLTEKGKNRTAEKIHILLNAVFEYALGDGIIQRSPLARVSLGNYERTHGTPLSYDEEKALVTALRNGGDKYIQAFVFLVYTGLRRSELATAEICDGWVTVRTAKVRKGKADKPRAIPIPPMLAQILPLIDLDEIKAITPTQLTKAFKKVMPTHHLHDTRHTFITRCQECGIRREIVSLWAGHSADRSITTTVYTHLEQNKALQVAEMSRFLYSL